MSVATCPYCREPVDSDTSNGLLCPRVRHSASFGLFRGERRLHRVRLLSRADGRAEAPTRGKRGVAWECSSSGASDGCPHASTSETACSNRPPVVLTTEFERSSILFGSAPPEPPPPLLPEESERKRTMFLVLGVTLGAFGAHSFYGGYRPEGFHTTWHKPC